MANFRTSTRTWKPQNERELIQVARCSRFAVCGLHTNRRNETLQSDSTVPQPHTLRAACENDSSSHARRSCATPKPRSLGCSVCLARFSEPPGAGENVLNKCNRFTTELTRGLRLQRCRIQCRTPRETGKHVGVTSILFVRRVPVADLKQYLSPAFDT